VLEQARIAKLSHELATLKQLAEDYAARVLSVISGQRLPTDATTDSSNCSSCNTASSDAHVIAGTDSNSSDKSSSSCTNSSSCLNGSSSISNSRNSSGGASTGNECDKRARTAYTND
jgi:hypothetical protein